MKLEEIILFTIVERTMIKHKYCSLSNILKNIGKYKDLKGVDNDELREAVTEIVGLFVEKELVALVCNPCADKQKNRICFAIHPEKQGVLLDYYKKDVKKRYDSLNKDEKRLLHSIYSKQVIKREPYILDDLSKQDRDFFEKNKERLTEVGFVWVKEEYHKDEEMLYCRNAVVSVAGKVACDNYSAEKVKTKYPHIDSNKDNCMGK